MTKVLNYIWRCWMLVLGIILTPILGIPVVIFSIRKEHYKYAFFFMRLWCFGMFYGMGFRYELINLTNKRIEKNRQYVFIANHTSLMDTMLPCILHPNHPICYVGKMELVKIPIFGIIYKRICVMVDRSSAKSRADVYRRCAERMQEGQSIALFPEGGIPDTSILLDEFKDGAFILSSKHHFPIAVYTFVGLKEMFPFNYGKGRPGKVKIYLNDILEPDQKMIILKETAHHLIKNTLEKSI